MLGRGGERDIQRRARVGQVGSLELNNGCSGMVMVVVVVSMIRGLHHGADTDADGGAQQTRLFSALEVQFGCDCDVVKVKLGDSFLFGLTIVYAAAFTSFGTLYMYSTVYKI